MADGTLIFDTKIDQGGFNKGLGSIAKTGASMVGSFVKLGAVLGGALAVGLGKKAISIASDLQEVQNVVDVSFGDMADKMENFSKTSLKTFGLSQLEAKRTGSTFMSMARGIGIAQESASDMSLTLTGLAGDMASFFNKDISETSSALKSIFTGNAIALTQYGIVMTATNLEQFRLEQGITKSYKAMTQAEKVQLRYNYVMSQTALAQGDFARTSGSWANQTKLLSENFKELLSIIGNGLIKVLTPLIQMLNVAVGKLIDFANAIAKVFGGSQLQATQQQAQAIGDTVDAEEDLADAVKDVDKANKKSMAGFDTIMQITEDTAKAQEGAGGGTAGFGLATSGLQEVDTSGMESSIDAIQKKIEELKTAIQNSVILQTLKEWAKTVSDMFMRVYQDGIKPMMDRLKRAWSDVWSTIKDTWAKWGEPIFSKIRQAIKTAGDVWKNAWDTIVKPVLNTLMENFDWLWEKHLQPLLANFLDFVGEFVNGALTIYNEFILPLVNWFVENFGPAISEVLSFIIDVFGTVIATISDVASGIITALKGIIQFIVGVFTGDWEKAWGGIKTFFKGIWDAIVGIVKGAVNLVIDFVNLMLKGMELAINKIIKMINKLSFDVPEWVPGIGGEKFGFDLKPVTFTKIPKLATGTVLPGGKPYMAVVNDQPAGQTNVEAPLSTIKDALIQALQEYGTQDLVADVVVNWNGEEVYNQIEKVKARRGTRIVQGGAV